MLAGVSSLIAHVQQPMVSATGGCFSHVSGWIRVYGTEETIAALSRFCAVFGLDAMWRATKYRRPLTFVTVQLPGLDDPCARLETLEPRGIVAAAMLSEFQDTAAMTFLLETLANSINQYRQQTASEMEEIVRQVEDNMVLLRQSKPQLRLALASPMTLPECVEKLSEMLRWRHLLARDDRGFAFESDHGLTTIIVRQVYDFTKRADCCNDRFVDCGKHHSQLSAAGRLKALHVIASFCHKQ